MMYSIFQKQVISKSKRRRHLDGRPRLLVFGLQETNTLEQGSND